MFYMLGFLLNLTSFLIYLELFPYNRRGAPIQSIQQKKDPVLGWVGGVKGVIITPAVEPRVDKDSRTVKHFVSCDVDISFLLPPFTRA